MIHISHITVTAYGSDPENRSNILHIADFPSFSGSGGGGDGPPKKAPAKKPTKPAPKKK